MKPITELIHNYLRHDKKFPMYGDPDVETELFLARSFGPLMTLATPKDEVLLVDRDLPIAEQLLKLRERAKTGRVEGTR